MNPIMSLLGGNNNNMMLKAVGAMMRGESPQSFLSSLANTVPQLKGMDFNNLESTARKMCAEKNINVDDAIAKVSSQVQSMK